MSASAPVTVVKGRTRYGRRGAGGSLGDEQVTTPVEVEAVRRRPGGGVRSRGAGEAVGHRERVDAVGGPLGDHELVAVGSERDLGGVDRAAGRVGSEGSGGAGDPAEAAVGVVAEGADGVAPLVEDVADAVAHGDADREVAVGRHGVAELEPLPAGVEGRDRVVAGVDREHQVPVAGETALRVQRGSGAQSAGGDGAGRLQGAVGVAVEDGDAVAGRGVRRLVHVADGLGRRGGRDAWDSERYRRRGGDGEQGGQVGAVHQGFLSVMFLLGVLVVRGRTATGGALRERG